MDKLLVIYHANCADGFGAAWCFWRRFGDAAEFLPAAYQNPPPDVTGRDVVLVDFSFKRSVLLGMARSARSLLVLDHHKSADEDLADSGEGAEAPVVRRVDHWLQAASGDVDPWARFQAQAEADRRGGAPCAIAYAAFDQERSGAGLAWDFLHPGTPRPALLNHIEDRDLWRFALPGTHEILPALFTYPQEFGLWDRMIRSDLSELTIEGRAIMRKNEKDIAAMVAASRRPMVIGGHTVPTANVPGFFSSEAGQSMAVGEVFSACYYDTASGRKFSLRSSPEGMDVSRIAAEYGGGGHEHAAGFSVPRDHPLAQA